MAPSSIITYLNDLFIQKEDREFVLKYFGAVYIDQWKPFIIIFEGMWEGAEGRTTFVNLLKLVPKFNKLFTFLEEGDIINDDFVGTVQSYLKPDKRVLYEGGYLPMIPKENMEGVEIIPFETIFTNSPDGENERKAISYDLYKLKDDFIELLVKYGNLYKKEGLTVPDKIKSMGIRHKSL